MATQLNFTCFERYRDIAGDWREFCAALAAPLPVSIWSNPARCTTAQLQAFLAEDGIPATRLPWFAGGLRLPEERNPGRHWTFMAGLSHVQEEVSMLPSLLLDAQPGERILDLCAAPGNKTAQLSLAMANTGTIVANDRSMARLRGLRQVLDRLGVINVAVSNCDGTRFPRHSYFDRVLVDAPCSCEGTSRKNPEVLQQNHEHGRLNRFRLQRDLLIRAVDLCRPGGRIVYSTCTYAPEENEMVVHAALEHFGDALCLLPARLPGLQAAEGLREWAGQNFPPAMRNALRIWPQHNDSGGFFIAVLEKSAGAGGGLSVGAVQNRDCPAVPEPPAHDAGGQSWLQFPLDRFGISREYFEGFRYYRQGRKSVYLAAAGMQLQGLPALHTCGMLFIRTGQRIVPKITSEGALFIASAARRNTVELDRAQLAAYITRRQDIPLQPAQLSACESKGYAMLSHRGHPFGIGFFQPTESGGHLESMFPKALIPNGLARAD